MSVARDSKGRFTKPRAEDFPPAPRQFRVGDRVRGEGHATGTVYTGTIRRFGPYGPVINADPNPNNAEQPILKRSSLELLEPAPGAPTPDLEALARTQAERIKKLEASLQAMTEERDKWLREVGTLFEANEGLGKALQAAESKLEDLRAILRTARLLQEEEEWTFMRLMEKVLGGRP